MSLWSSPRGIAGAITIFSLFAITGSLSAETTAITGGGQPYSTQQPSLAINYLVTLEGAFQDVGEITMFAGNYAPIGTAFADGRLLPISQYDSLYAQIGTTYGGDGLNTFALPDLRGRTPIGFGQGAGLTPRTLGETTGVETQTLSEAQLPAHTHTMPAPNGPTSSAGSGQPINNMQPSLAVNYRIVTQGIYPPRNLTAGGANLGSGDAYIAAVGMYAGNSSLPNNTVATNGQLLSIAQNTALFSLLGTTYGGNGVTTFALPDLQGRSAVHSGQGPGLSPYFLGEETGVEQQQMFPSQMPAHDHKLPPSANSTGVTGGGQPMENMQPSLGLNYMIAMQGIYPPRGLAGDSLDGDHSSDLAGIEPYLGEIGIFAGNFAPQGWALADGQLLSIAQNTALFSLLGTSYGGNGVTTFALPDLRGRVAVGAGQGPGLADYVLGESWGTETTTLTLNQLAPHDHDYTQVPEPSTLLLAACGVVGPLVVARRKR